MEHCHLCGADISRDEIGLTKKLVNRGTQDYLCFACLRKRFAMTRADLDELAQHFREAGCHFFV